MLRFGFANLAFGLSLIGRELLLSIFELPNELHNFHFSTCQFARECMILMCLHRKQKRLDDFPEANLAETCSAWVLHELRKDVI